MPPEIRIDLPEPRVTVGQVVGMVGTAVIFVFLVAVAYFISAVANGRGHGG